MVAKLAEKSDKADALLREVAQNVKDGKKTTMDPALTDEVKRLLGCVATSTSSVAITHAAVLGSGIRTGVDEHVKDFRGQLTSEVRFLFGVPHCAFADLFRALCTIQVQRMFKEVRLDLRFAPYSLLTSLA